MDPIKDAFARAKQDIADLKVQIMLLSQQLDEIKQTLSQVSKITTNQPTQETCNPTSQAYISTAEKIPTDNLPFKAVKRPFFEVSSGNDGVPTDRQTNQQTNQQTGNGLVLPIQNAQDSIQRVSELLDSLDTIKQEVRFKFKKLTSQEMLVFSTIYQLEGLGLKVDYSLVAKKLSLTESSIRDYTQKIIKKGIPLIKFKENNKKIFLSISPDLKKIASLSTILQLREI